MSHNRIYVGGTALRVGGTQVVIASILADAMPNLATHEMIISGMSGATPSEWDDTNLKVAICKLRKLLGPYGITIETVWSRGYRMVVGKSTSST